MSGPFEPELVAAALPRQIAHWEVQWSSSAQAWFAREPATAQVLWQGQWDAHCLDAPVEGQRSRAELCRALGGLCSVELDSELGAGSFGVVRRGVYFATGEACAVKCMVADADSLEEVRLQEELRHPSLCVLLGSVSIDGQLFVALELCSGGDLRDHIHSRAGVPFSWAETRTHMSELLSAVAYVHSRGVAHRDIKPENLLMQENAGQEMLSLKLADFGLAARCPHGCFLDGSGTIPYMAPEQLRHSCNEACDVWACGCVFFELVCGEVLVSSVFWKHRRKAYDYLFSSSYGASLRRFDGTCGACLEGPALIRLLLHRAWKNRWSAMDASQHSFFRMRSGAAGECALSVKGVDTVWGSAGTTKKAGRCKRRWGRRCTDEVPRSLALRVVSWGGQSGRYGIHDADRSVSACGLRGCQGRGSCAGVSARDDDGVARAEKSKRVVEVRVNGVGGDDSVDEVSDVDVEDGGQQRSGEGEGEEEADGAGEVEGGDRGCGAGDDDEEEMNSAPDQRAAAHCLPPRRRKLGRTGRERARKRKVAGCIVPSGDDNCNMARSSDNSVMAGQETMQMWSQTGAGVVGTSSRQVFWHKEILILLTKSSVWESCSEMEKLVCILKVTPSLDAFVLQNLMKVHFSDSAFQSWDWKCLQVAVLVCCGTSHSADVAEHIMGRCCNMAGSCSNGTLEEQHIFYIVEAALLCAGCFAWIFESDSLQSLISGELKGRWHIGDSSGLCIGSLAWLKYELHVVCLIGLSCQNHLTGFWTSDNECPPWMRYVVGAPKKKKNNQGAHLKKGGSQYQARWGKAEVEVGGTLAARSSVQDLSVPLSNLGGHCSGHDSGDGSRTGAFNTVCSGIDGGAGRPVFAGETGVGSASDVPEVGIVLASNAEEGREDGNSGRDGGAGRAAAPGVPATDVARSCIPVEDRCSGVDWDSSGSDAGGFTFAGVSASRVAAKAVEDRCSGLDWDSSGSDAGGFTFTGVSSSRVAAKAVKDRISGLEWDSSGGSDASGEGMPRWSVRLSKRRAAAEAKKVADAEAARTYQPVAVDASRCQALMWNRGYGKLQCGKPPESGSDLCKQHQRAPHGKVRGPIPEKKLAEFAAAALKPAKESVQWYARHLMWAYASKMSPTLECLSDMDESGNYKLTDIEYERCLAMN